MPHLRVWIWRPTPRSATDDRHGRRCQKNRHKSLIDAATHIHCVYVDSFWETITYLTPTAADIYKGYSAKSMRDVPYDTRATAGRGARREQKAPRTAAEPALTRRVTSVTSSVSSNYGITSPPPLPPGSRLFDSRERWKPTINMALIYPYGFPKNTNWQAAFNQPHSVRSQSPRKGSVRRFPEQYVNGVSV